MGKTGSKRKAPDSDDASTKKKPKTIEPPKKSNHRHNRRTTPNPAESKTELTAPPIRGMFTLTLLRVTTVLHRRIRLFTAHLLLTATPGRVAKSKPSIVKNKSASVRDSDIEGGGSNGLDTGVNNQNSLDKVPEEPDIHNEIDAAKRSTQSAVGVEDTAPTEFEPIIKEPTPPPRSAYESDSSEDAHLSAPPALTPRKPMADPISGRPTKGLSKMTPGRSASVAAFDLSKPAKPNNILRMAPRRSVLESTFGLSHQSDQVDKSKLTTATSLQHPVSSDTKLSSEPFKPRPPSAAKPPKSSGLSKPRPVPSSKIAPLGPRYVEVSSDDEDEDGDEASDYGTKKGRKNHHSKGSKDMRPTKKLIHPDDSHPEDNSDDSVSDDSGSDDSGSDDSHSDSHSDDSNSDASHLRSANIGTRKSKGSRDRKKHGRNSHKEPKKYIDTDSGDSGDLSITTDSESDSSGKRKKGKRSNAKSRSKAKGKRGSGRSTVGSEVASDPDGPSKRAKHKGRGEGNKTASDKRTKGKDLDDRRRGDKRRHASRSDDDRKRSTGRKKGDDRKGRDYRKKKDDRRRDDRKRDDRTKDDEKGRGSNKGKGKDDAKPPRVKKPGTLVWFQAQGDAHKKFVMLIKRAFFCLLVEDNWWPLHYERVGLSAVAYRRAMTLMVPSPKLGEAADMPFPLDEHVRTLCIAFPTEFRGNVKATAVKRVRSLYKLFPLGSDEPTDPSYTSNRVQELLADNAFTKGKDDIVGTDDAIFTIVTETWYRPKMLTEPREAAVVSPMPACCIALAMTATQCALSEWKTGQHIRVDMHQSVWEPIYQTFLLHLNTLVTTNKSKWDEIQARYAEIKTSVIGPTSKWMAAAAVFEEGSPAPADNSTRD
ncbi:hypothetical protein FRC19_006893 [Serendipita sp. 401]|nr:hypothetical protein FRC19_006893 [Serendipita sp. 401]